MEAKKEIVFPELSYQIIGAAFGVFNDLGWGLTEKDYQKALAKELDSLRFKYEREVYIPIQYKLATLSRYYADFIVEGKILLELKAVPKLGYVHAKQLFNYLRSTGLRLGILIYFTKEGIKYRRGLNPS